jgi:benzodiazapine receptor
MLALLLSLIALYIQIKETEYTFFDLFPFSVYLGWISVATIANISYVLTYYQWNGFGLSDITWTILMMIVATGLAIVFIFREKDWAFPLVIV